MINYEQVRRAATGSADNDAVLSFRLPETVKADLLEVCARDQLSLGRLMRELAKEFLRNAD